MSEEIPERIGGYEILRVIGRGGMGVLYHARDTARRREVALKVMSSDIIEDDVARARFQHEARLAARLQHRNIVKVFEFGEDGDLPFIAMEFLRGRSLSDRMTSGEPMPLETKLDVVIQVCEGLQCLHQEGIVHRDVKPGNVWLLEDGGVKLLDLGIAKHAGVNLTQYGNVVGSAAYIAPEQLSGQPVDGRADIFSAGVVLYELLCGRKPFQADSITAVMMKVLHEAAPDIRRLVPGLSGDVADAIDVALQKDPARRYSQAAEFASDLRLARAAGETPVPLAPARPDAPRPAPAPAVVELALDATMISARASGHGVTDTEPDVVLRHASDLPLEQSPHASHGSPRSGGRGAWAWLGVVAVLLVAGAAVFLWRRADASYVLDVRSSPEGARISLDGVDTGRRTPAVVTVASRPGRIGLSLSGYEVVDAALASTSVSPVELAYTLKRLLQVDSQPAGARILIDGRDTGLVTPASLPVEEPYPEGVDLQLDGHRPIREPVTREVVAAGRLWVKLSPVSDPIGAEPPPGSTPQVVVNLTGSYRFGVTGCGTASPAAQSHALQVTAPCTLRLRASEYFLDVMRNVTAVAGGRMDLVAPPLASVQLRSRHEDCTLHVGGRAVGTPPVDLELAAGNYSATLQCPDGQTLETRAFAVEAGKSVRRIDDYLR